MTVISEKIEELSREVNALYADALGQKKPENLDLVEYTPISEEAFVHAFMTGIPGFRSAVGGRIAKSLALGEIYGKVEPWEQTIEIALNDIRSNRKSRYLDAASEMGVSAALLPEELLGRWLNIAHLAANPASLNYDGNPTFDQHVTPAGTTNNNDLSLAYSKTNLEEAVTTMLSFTNDEGAPLGINPTHLIVPPALYIEASQDQDVAFDAAGATNWWKGRLTVVKNHFLSATDAWFLVDASKVRPFTYYEYEAPNLVTVDRPDSSVVFNQRKIKWGQYAQSAIRPAPYQYLLRSQG